jgi:hypothetical protein
VPSRQALDFYETQYYRYCYRLAVLAALCVFPLRKLAGGRGRRPRQQQRSKEIRVGCHARSRSYWSSGSGGAEIIHSLAAMRRPPRPAWTMKPPLRTMTASLVLALFLLTGVIAPRGAASAPVVVKPHKATLAKSAALAVAEKERERQSARAAKKTTNGDSASISSAGGAASVIRQNKKPSSTVTAAAASTGVSAPKLKGQKFQDQTVELNGDVFSDRLSAVGAPALAPAAIRFLLACVVELCAREKYQCLRCTQASKGRLGRRCASHCFGAAVPPSRGPALSDGIVVDLHCTIDCHSIDAPSPVPHPRPRPRPRTRTHTRRRFSLWSRARQIP